MDPDRPGNAESSSAPPPHPGPLRPSRSDRFPTYFRALRHRNFRLFWCGQIVSLIGTWMTEAGHEFYFLTRYPHDRRLVRRFVHLRRLLGMGAIRDLPRRACMRGMFEALDSNAVIFMQLDPRSRDAGGAVEYFGRPFHAFTGPVAMALKTGAAVVPMYIVRESGIRQRLVIEPEFELERTGDRQADVKKNLQRLMHIFEGWVRRSPENYWWFNRRWDGV